jgi:hypothetical protein
MTFYTFTIEILLSWTTSTEEGTLIANKYYHQSLRIRSIVLHVYQLEIQVHDEWQAAGGDGGGERHRRQHNQQPEAVPAVQKGGQNFANST